MKRFLIFVAWLPLSFIGAIPLVTVSAFVWQDFSVGFLVDTHLRSTAYVNGIAAGWYVFGERL